MEGPDILENNEINNWEGIIENNSTENNKTSLIKNTIPVEDIRSLKNELINEKQKAQEILSVLKSLTANSEISKDVFETIRTKINESYDAIQKSQQEIKNEKSLNTKLHNELVLQESKVKDLLEIVRWYINDSKSIKNNISTLEKQLLSKEKSSLAIKENIEQIKIQSNVLKNEIQSISKTINNMLKDWTKIIEQLKADKIVSNSMIDYIKWINIETKKNHTEIVWILNKWKESFKVIQEKEKEVNKLYWEAKTKNNHIVLWYEKLFKLWWTKEEINKIENKIRENQMLIEQQLSEASANRLTTTLKSKLEKTEKSLFFWRRGVIWMVISLVILNFSLHILWYLYESFRLDYRQYIEFTYPLIFLLVFFVLQYSRTNKFYEEYYFKYISAFWLPAYFELLESKNDEKAMNYLIDTIEKIHTNPTQEINNNSKDTIFDYVLDWLKWFFWNWSKTLDINKILKNLTKEQVWEIWDYIRWKI